MRVPFEALNELLEYLNTKRRVSLKAMLNHKRKIIEPDSDPASILDFINSLPRPLVFTNGCFDILHRGHTSYLEDARNLGASLIVALNTDASVQRLGKGEDRPINRLEDRMAIVASLDCVDAVISFSEDTPIDVIELVKPDHLVKGGDWKISDIVGGDYVIEMGGKVHSIEFQFDRSTTDLISRIRASQPCR